MKNITLPTIQQVQEGVNTFFIGHQSQIDYLCSTIKAEEILLNHLGKAFHLLDSCQKHDLYKKS